MSGFKYELENILNLREQEENIKQKEYAEALEKLKYEKQKKIKINKSLKTSRDKFKASISKNIEPNKIRLQQNYQMYLENEHKLATVKVEKAENKTEEQRKELLDAMKNKKTLEVLREKRFEEYIEEEKKVEQQVVDEIVSFTFNQS